MLWVTDRGPGREIAELCCVVTAADLAEALVQSFSAGTQGESAGGGGLASAPAGHGGVPPGEPVLAESVEKRAGGVKGRRRLRPLLLHVHRTCSFSLS